MSFNLFASPTKDDIKVGYVDPILGYVEDVSISDANFYANDNPGTTFIFRDGNNVIRYLNINEVNKLTVNDLVATQGECGGIQVYKECGPPKIQFFGGGGIGAAGNPVIGRDGSLLAVDVVRGGHGYQYPPIVAAKDDCQFGSGTVLTSVLGETADQIEVYEGEEDYEEYELSEDTDVGYGFNYGPNGEELGKWEPGIYTRVGGADPIQREIEIYQKALKTPFWTTRKAPTDKITTSEITIYSDPYFVTHPEWGEFMNTYAISPVKPSEFIGSDEAGIVFSMEWEENFPITGEYIFRGTCDNSASVYIDGQSIGKLQSFRDNPKPFQKTIQEGNHVIKIDLTNAPIYETITTQISNLIDVDFQVYGKGAYKDLAFTFTSEDGQDSFTIKGAQKSGETRTETIKLKPNIKYRVRAVEDSSKYKSVEQGLIKNGTKAKEAGIGSANKIFADYITSGNDNDDIQVTASQGTFTSSNKRSTSNGRRSTYDLVFKVTNTSGAPTVSIKEVISPKSWQQNPMGVSMTIDAPLPIIPQEQPPVQTGRCPPNPIWSTRFPGSSQKWYPVRFTFPNSWSKFMNRYAISPVLPLENPGSDTSGATFSTSWQIDLPYSGFYGVKGTRDNSGRILIDGKEVSILDAFSINNPKTVKIYLLKGRHTITAEVFNQPKNIASTVDTKIFSTQDWRSAPTTSVATTEKSNIRAKFILQGKSAYLQVDGTGSGEISFVMDVNDASYIAGLAAKEIIIPSDSGKVNFKRKSLEYGGSFDLTAPTQETIKNSGTFTGGKKYGPIEIIGAGAGARGPIINDSNRLGIRDADGDDENIKVTIGDIKLNTTTTTTPNLANSAVNITKNGVIYSGPELFANIPGPEDPRPEIFGYKETRWSKFMNDFSVSPKVFNSLSSPENSIIGTYTLTWKNVNFPYGGSYKFNFQADNSAILKIGGREILKTSDFVGQKVQYTFNITPGKYDIEIQLENTKSSITRRLENDYIFIKNPMGVALFISKDVVVSGTNRTSWVQNPMGISAILIPPPCAKKIGGRGVVEKVIVDDPGNGYLPSEETSTYEVTLILDEVIVENPGINYRCGEDPIQITPSNGAVLNYSCDSFGRITSVSVLNPGAGFNVYPEITISSETGVNAKFKPVFRVIRDPILQLAEQQITQENLIQVTDLVGLKQTGYVDGRAYYGAVYYDAGAPYAGYYKTVGTQIRVYNTLQESITAKAITPASAIQRSGTDITSNDPRLNIPGTPESTTEQT